MTKDEKDAFRQEARDLYKEECVEIDSIATVSHTEDWRGNGGAYVQAWLWVPTPQQLEASDAADRVV